MTTLNILTHHARCCFFKQLVQQHRRLAVFSFNLTKWKDQENRRNHDLTYLDSQKCLTFLKPQLLAAQSPIHTRLIANKTSPDCTEKAETKTPTAIKDDDLFAETSKLGLFAKFKLMYKKYWYVLIPVHIVTSIGWFAGFYYLSQSGVDIPTLLQQVHVSEKIIESVKNSNMGHLAIAYLCYKIATPLRYAVTLGGTTVTIKYLVQAGYIRPMPTKQQIMDMYEQKKADRAAAKEKDK